MMLLVPTNMVNGEKILTPPIILRPRKCEKKSKPVKLVQTCRKVVQKCGTTWVR